MTTNPNKETMKARNYIAKQLTDLKAEGRPVHDIVLKTLLNFPVTDSWPLRFINKHFVETGRFEIVDGIIREVTQ